MESNEILRGHDENNEVKRYLIKILRSKYKVPRAKFTSSQANFSKIILKYSSEVQLLRY